MSNGLQIPDPIVAGLEQGLNRYLALDPEGAERLAALNGRVVCIEVSGFGTRLYLIPSGKEIQAFGAYAGEPDCVLSGTPLALARIGLADRKEDQLFSGDVRISGDTHLAQQFGRVLAGVDIDWEEQVSRVTGDPIAHQVGSAIRVVQRWGHRSVDTLAQDIREYLQEEGRLVPTRYEIELFLDEVDTLRDDVERLAVRVERLTKRMSQPGGRQ